ncbi:TetR/AcrR family transcriptional regulator [Mycolicibacterium sp.]|uniref:TetR/AcrR family transcriptional regulator n=1 Tax=Mycolicibacterium sp. TaxID=2320850 RepID=UPI003D0FD548
MPERVHSADPRAERVRSQLRTAALALATERRVDEITVADLVARAAVSRQVFYRHFRDRDDAVAAAFTEAFAAAVAVGAGHDARTRITRLFGFAAEHRAMYRNVVPSSVMQRVVAAFRAALQPACETIAAQGMAVVSQIAPLPAESLTRFLVGGFVEVLRSWMEDPEPTDLLARLTAALDTVDVLLGISPDLERNP